MATFVLIHGASANAHYWYRVKPGLQAAGHDVVTPDLPTGDPSATFQTYARAVIDAIGDRSNLVIVGQSMGAFTAAIVASQLPTRLLILLAPMIPAPARTPASGAPTSGWPRHSGATPRQPASTRHST